MMEVREAEGAGEEGPSCQQRPQPVGLRPLESECSAAQMEFQGCSNSQRRRPCPHTEML